MSHKQHAQCTFCRSAYPVEDGTRDSENGRGYCSLACLTQDGGSRKRPHTEPGVVLFQAAVKLIDKVISKHERMGGDAYNVLVWLDTVKPSIEHRKAVRELAGQAFFEWTFKRPTYHYSKPREVMVCLLLARNDLLQAYAREYAAATDRMLEELQRKGEASDAGS